MHWDAEPNFLWEQNRLQSPGFSPGKGSLKHLTHHEPQFTNDQRSKFYQFKGPFLSVVCLLCVLKNHSLPGSFSLCACNTDYSDFDNTISGVLNPPPSLPRITPSRARPDTRQTDTASRHSPLTYSPEKVDRIQDQHDRVLRPLEWFWGQLGPGVLSPSVSEVILVKCRLLLRIRPPHLRPLNYEGFPGNIRRSRGKSIERRGA